MTTFQPYDYQVRAIEQFWAAMREDARIRPCLAMPGGSGKSMVNAEIIRQTMAGKPTARILMVVRSMELVKHDADALRKLWPGAPMGVVCSGMRKKEWGEPIIIASTGSVAKHAERLGHIDLFLIDEAQDMSDDDDSAIRKLVAALLERNPDMRIGGYSASPYRLSQGMLTDGDNPVFNRILEPVSIEELIHRNKLMPLRSKQTVFHMDTAGVHKSGGDFIASEMAAKFNTLENNAAVVAEVKARAESYRHWLVFCSNRQHAADVASAFREAGVPADSVDSGDPVGLRKRKIADFESGKIRALCNVGILTTGYDFPALDCIVFLRDTMSPGLYLQSAVRGMRIKPHTDHCLVLDFVGVVQRHGPITRVNPPKAKGNRAGDTPMKVCDACDELCLMFATVCPACGAPFKVAPKGSAPKEPLVLHDDDIMGWEDEFKTVEVKGWRWRIQRAIKKPVDLIAVSYYSRVLSDPPIVQYLCVQHGGLTERKAWDDITKIAQEVVLPPGVLASGDLEALCAAMTEASPPRWIQYFVDGKYKRITRRAWDESQK